MYSFNLLLVFSELISGIYSTQRTQQLKIENDRIRKQNGLYLSVIILFLKKQSLKNNIVTSKINCNKF